MSAKSKASKWYVCSLCGFLGIVVMLLIYMSHFGGMKSTVVSRQLQEPSNKGSRWDQQLATAHKDANQVQDEQHYANANVERGREEGAKGVDNQRMEISKQQNWNDDKINQGRLKHRDEMPKRDVFDRRDNDRVIAPDLSDRFPKRDNFEGHGQSRDYRLGNTIDDDTGVARREDGRDHFTSRMKQQPHKYRYDSSPNNEDPNSFQRNWDFVDDQRKSNFFLDDQAQLNSEQIADFSSFFVFLL
ncbi:hypothetical protein RFI_12180 [Reticulomyxa filosa]|uniref:Uncharacterized protein n=1 Tax=Reticulomyxa filosa TaxID=46433 RepID=X6NG66_RETFI|nr:hypothetical protein RFI_12180 [Reticulomyxa filosa]|eukprot:ETO24961.1 hypothetical protein RFI_12180 [Reticulomyxa filosa]